MQGILFWFIQTDKTIYYNSLWCKLHQKAATPFPGSPHTLLTLPETACLNSAWKISSAAPLPVMFCIKRTNAQPRIPASSLNWMIRKDRHIPMFSASTASESPLLACTNPYVGAEPGIVACSRISTHNSVVMAIK